MFNCILYYAISVCDTFHWVDINVCVCCVCVYVCVCVRLQLLLKYNRCKTSESVTFIFYVGCYCGTHYVSVNDTYKWSNTSHYAINIAQATRDWHKCVNVHIYLLSLWMHI